MTTMNDLLRHADPLGNEPPPAATAPSASAAIAGLRNIRLDTPSMPSGELRMRSRRI